ncbi:MAG: PaaI family thioesterase [Cyclobacteriaceae bacterium]|nr:PaaI family thioesterase [Cyclobacteriaceae bacterium]
MNERTRTYSWQDPMESAKKGLQLSGMDYLMAMKNGELPPPPIMNTLDLNMGTLEFGKVSFVFQPQEFHYNPLGTVHGGVITTLLDSAMGCALHSTLPQGTGYTTLELKVNFLRPISIKSKKLTCSGKVINAGSKTALMEAQLIDDDGKVYAHGVSTCMLLSLGEK